MSNEPLSERYRKEADRWVRLESAASLLEESKSAVMAQRQVQHGDIPVAHAERLVKASPQWEDYIKKMVKAREEANLAKVELEFIRMKYWEESSENATRRQELRMTGT